MSHFKFVQPRPRNGVISANGYARPQSTTLGVILKVFLWLVWTFNPTYIDCGKIGPPKILHMIDLQCFGWNGGDIHMVGIMFTLRRKTTGLVVPLPMLLKWYCPRPPPGLEAFENASINIFDVNNILVSVVSLSFFSLQCPPTTLPEILSQEIAATMVTTWMDSTLIIPRNFLNEELLTALRRVVVPSSCAIIPLPMKRSTSSFKTAKRFNLFSPLRVN